MQRTRISCSSEELPGTPGKAKSCLHSAGRRVWELVSQEQRKSKPWTFILPGHRNKSCFSGGAGRDSQPCLWDCVLLTWCHYTSQLQGEPLSPVQVLLPYRPQKTLESPFWFFFSPHKLFWWKEKMVLPGTRITACASLCRRVYLKSYLCPLQRACLRHTASLRWQTRLKITCGTSLVQFHVTCLPSPCIDGNKIFVTA